MDECALRIPSNAWPTGLWRVSKAKISRDLRAHRVPPGKRKTRPARVNNGIVRQRAWRSARPSEAMGRKDSGEPELRSGNFQSFPKSEAATDDARPASVTRGANRARTDAEDEEILSVLRDRALADGGEAREEDSRQRNSRACCDVRRPGARSQDVDATSMRISRSQFRSRNRAQPDESRSFLGGQFRRGGAFHGNQQRTRDALARRIKRG